MDRSADDLKKAKDYQRLRQVLTMAGLAWTPAVLLAAVLTPLSRAVCGWAGETTPSQVILPVFYYALFSVYLLAAELPLSFFSGYAVEHRFGLSNQKLSAWIAETLKKYALGLALTLPLVAGLYALIWYFPSSWWVLAWAAYAAVAFGIGKIFPTVIVPLFYRYGKIEDPGLEARIRGLAERYGLAVSAVYSLNLSKTTKKANAAFMGLGKTKRVVLSDTLLAGFSRDEIEAVVAHELGHFVHKDIWKHLAASAAASFGAFWIASFLFERAAGALGYRGAGDVAALPLLFLIFYVFNLFLTPLGSWFSRRMEYAADRFSLEALGRADVFISCMKKLSRINLADPEPHPLYEWFFYDHPSVGKRIRAAEGFAAARAGEAV